MTGRRIIRGVHVLALDGRRMVRKTDILIERGVIAALGGVDTAGALITDARGVLMPGLVQAHAHLDQSLLDRRVVPSVDPRFFQSVQVRAWRETLDVDGARAQLSAGLCRGLLSGSVTFADGAQSDPVNALDTASTYGVRYITCLDGTRPGLERRLGALEEQIEASSKLMRIAIWVGSTGDVSSRRLKRAANLAEQHRLPLIAHAGLNPGDKVSIPKLDRAGALNKRLVLCHGSGGALDDPACVPALSQAGVSVILTPTFDILRGAPPAPLAALVEAKVTLGLGSDTGATRLSLNMFREIRCLAGLLKGKVESPASLALEIGTRGGARALSVEAGSIEVGQSADLLLLDVDVYAGEQHEAVAQRVIEQGGPKTVRNVWTAGHVVMADGRITKGRAPDDALEAALRELLGARTREAERGFRGRTIALLERLGRPLRRRRGWR